MNRYIDNNNSESEATSKNIFGVYILFGIILFYPDSLQGILIYLPQIIIGFIALYSIVKTPLLKPTKRFLSFALYLTLANIFVSLLRNNFGLVEVLKSSLRLYYPFIGIVIGGLLKKKITPKPFLKVLMFFLFAQFIVSFLQIRNESFRVFSFSLYRPSILDYYLTAFSWKTGRRVIGTVANPNSLGMLMIIMNSSIIFLSDYTRNKFITSILCTGATFYVCLNTQSRTAILLFFAINFLLFYWKLNQKGLAKILCLYIFGLFIGISFLYIRGLANREISIAALDPRYLLWSSHIAQMLSYEGFLNLVTVVFGVGFTNAREYGTYDNIYVKYFVSGGIIGLLIFLKTGLQTIKFFLRNVYSSIWRRMGLAVVFVWLLGSIVAEYQEIFKLSIITFILLGYAMYPSKYLSEQENINSGGGRSARAVTNC